MCMCHGNSHLKVQCWHLCLVQSSSMTFYPPLVGPGAKHRDKGLALVEAVPGNLYQSVDASCVTNGPACLKAKAGVIPAMG